MGRAPAAQSVQPPLPVPLPAVPLSTSPPKHPVDFSYLLFCPPAPNASPQGGLSLLAPCPQCLHRLWLAGARRRVLMKGSVNGNRSSGLWDREAGGGQAAGPLGAVGCGQLLPAWLGRPPSGGRQAPGLWAGGAGGRLLSGHRVFPVLFFHVSRLVGAPLG